MTGSEELFERARAVMPGGVSSPVRAFNAVGGVPKFMTDGSGARVTDVDGREYIDLLGSWGPLILGHAHPAVVDAVGAAAASGTSFGAPIENEVRLAELITGALPSVDMVRFVSSGTEAAMSAIRLARAVTGRTRILKFEGCYHGHSDGMLVAAGSGPATLGLPDSPGVPEAVAAETIVAEFNSIATVEEAFGRFKKEIAAVIVEPVAANMGVIPASQGFLEALRDICSAGQALLIFDEVVTGFRVGWQGAQGMTGVMPDLTILGKVIGGGLPIGAYGGDRSFMELVAPAGPVYQAGTLSGNPVSVAAGLATLSALKFDPNIYARLDGLGSQLEEGLSAGAKEAGVDLSVQRVGSMLTAFFQDGSVNNFADARRSSTSQFATFFNVSLEQGVYWPPSQFESSFVSAAHTPKDIETVISISREAFKQIKESTVG